MSGRVTRSRAGPRRGTIVGMAVHVDVSLPVHPLTVDDLAAMVDAGILGEDDHIELLDGVLVEMSPQGEPHAHAIRRLTMRLVPSRPPPGSMSARSAR